LDRPEESKGAPRQSFLKSKLAIGVIGAMQLRYDDRLSEESFRKLVSPPIQDRLDC